MPRLIHDSGGPATLKCRQVLGDGSPLEFDANGHYHLDDQDTAERIAAMHRHVSVDVGAEAGADASDFDAESFVDRTPMADVVDDLESGAYDAHLDAIEAAESGGRDRQGVADAIASRREA